MTKLIDIIKTFNEQSQIKIEFATLSPMSVKRKSAPENYLHLIYSPSMDYLLESYVSIGNTAGAKEYVDNVALLVNELKQFPPKPGITYSIKESDFEMPLGCSLSTVSKLCKFELTVPSDPCLMLFANDENVVYATNEFTEYVLDNKDVFTPTKLSLLNNVQQSLRAHCKTFNNLSAYSDADKIQALLLEVLNSIKLYFIAMNYEAGFELSPMMTEKQNYILNTLSVASNPWVFVDECIKNTTSKINALEPLKLGDVYKEKKQLQALCLKFLNTRLTGELINDSKLYCPTK